MKTKEQILEHLSNVGYAPNALCKILGFLIGAGLKEESEKVCVKTTGLSHSWEDFWLWYNSNKNEDVCSDCPLCDMLNELIRIMETEEDPEKVQKAHERYEFLICAFGLD